MVNPNVVFQSNYGGGDMVASAPNVQVNKVSTFHELDNQLLAHAAFSTLGDIGGFIIILLLLFSEHCVEK